MVEVGQVMSGKYKLLRLLGDGGMGSVYEAEHVNLGTHVAIKVLHADLARRAGIAERFLQEARVSAQIRSAHVVQVTDVDRTPDGVAYLVMELLQGEPLSGVVRRERKLAVGTACEYTIQILNALEAAHSLGVIHRDLKPDNVFVTFTGGKPVLKLIDFGIAKLKTEQTGKTKNLTVAGMLMGTPEYMAPEQAYSADKVDVRADIYAVGVMLYEMLAGVPPVEAADPRVLIGKVERGEITPLVQAAPGIEPALAGLVHRAMAPRPELRFATATEMRVALEDFASGKRPGTAKIQATPAISAANPVGPTSLPDPSAKGPSTAVAAPIDAAFSVTPQPRGATEAVQAVPMMGAPQFGSGTGPPPPNYGAPPPYQQAPAYAPPPQMERRKSGNGLIFGLAAAALLLGGGAVVAYMLESSPTPPSPVPLIPTTTTPTQTAPTVTTPGTPTTPPTITPPIPPGPQPGPGPHPFPTHHDGGAPAHDGGPGPAPATPDAGSGQTVIVTPFGTFQFPGPRPLFYPADQPWPPPNINPIPAP